MRSKVFAGKSQCDFAKESTEAGEQADDLRVGGNAATLARVALAFGSKTKQENRYPSPQKTTRIGDLGAFLHEETDVFRAGRKVQARSVADEISWMGDEGSEGERN